MPMLDEFKQDLSQAVQQYTAAHAAITPERAQDIDDLNAMLDAAQSATLLRQQIEFKIAKMSGGLLAIVRWLDFSDLKNALWQVLDQDKYQPWRLAVGEISEYADLTKRLMVENQQLRAGSREDATHGDAASGRAPVDSKQFQALESRLQQLELSLQSLQQEKDLWREKYRVSEVTHQKMSGECDDLKKQLQHKQKAIMQLRQLNLDQAARIAELEELLESRQPYISQPLTTRKTASFTGLIQ